MDSPIIARLIGWGVAAVLTCFMLLLILMPTPAKATGNHCGGKQCSNPVISQPSHSQSSAQAGAFASATGGAGGTAHGFGGSTSNEQQFYVLPAPIGGSNLPAGICQRSRYEHFSIGWNFVSSAKGDSHTDMDCMNAILAAQKARHEAANPPRLPPPTACERAAHKASVAKKKPKVCP